MQEWAERGLCRGQNNEDWFPERSNDSRIPRVKKICNACPVKQPCLEFALEQRMPDGSEFLGIWGGTTEEDRRMIRAVLGGRSYEEVKREMTG